MSESSPRGLRLVARWWWLVWKDSPFALTLILTFSFASAGLLAGFPWLWQYAIESLEGSPSEVREVAGWMLAVAVCQWLLYMVLQGTRTVMNARLQWRARGRVFDHLTELDPSFYRRWRTGDLVTRLYDDAGEKISWFLCSGVFRAYEAALILCTCLGAMLWLDWRLTLWVTLPLPVLLVAQALAQNALGRRYLAVQRSISSINDQLATTFEGIRVVQACGLQDTVSQTFTERARVQQHAEVRTAVMQQAVFLQYGFGWQLAMVALLLAGGRGVIEGSITLGQFVTFEGLVMTLVWPMFDFGMFVSKVMQASVALQRLQELVDEPQPEGRWGEGTPAAPSLTARSVDVHAEDGAALVRDLDLDLQPGEHIALVGEVGSGKSTVMGLLAGLRQPASGVVQIGTNPRQTLRREAVRDMLAFVPQDPLLISATVRDNITLGRDIPDTHLLRAIEVSRLAGDLPALTDGLDTFVGERGVTLSGGQQQRVAIARALAGSPRVLLLDDATAALDADTEAAFWAALEEGYPEVSTVVVTHRVATLEHMDRVLVLESGQICQRGQHSQLVEQQGPYQRIYGRFAAAAKIA